MLITKTHFIRALCFLLCKKEKYKKVHLNANINTQLKKNNYFLYSCRSRCKHIYSTASGHYQLYKCQRKQILVVDSFSVSKFNFTISRYASFHILLGYAHFHSLLQANLVSVKYTSFFISFMRQQYKNGLKAEFANNTVIV